MANSANAVWATSGPQFTNQVMAFGGRDASELAYHGYASFTGDAATATLTVNFIDGTQTPFFTQANPPVAVAPKAVLVGPMSGTNSANNVIQGIVITSTGFVVTFAGNPPANAYILPFIVFPYTT